MTSPTTERPRPFPSEISSDSLLSSETLTPSVGSDRDYNANDKKFVVSQDSGIAEESEQEVKASSMEVKVTAKAKADNIVRLDNGSSLTSESSTDSAEFKFAQKMRDSDVYINDSARFDVKFTGAGAGFKVKWYKNDMELMESKKYEFRTSSDRCSLVVRNCGISDEGMYECKVTVAAESGGKTIGCEADLYVAGTGRK